MIVSIGHDAKRVADYILWLSEKNPVTPMQLLKLVYMCHGWMLGLYGRPLVSDRIEAWPYGPVIPRLYQANKHYGSGFIGERPSAEPVGFLPDEVSVMHQVWRAYGNFTGLQLSALTHKPGTPWEITCRTRGGGSVISNDLIEQYYRQLLQTRG
ncbi:MAG TPA: type II toxin-antitoxin system antitoxin SocA domain-containing protein [Bryobacteraceae bacterium]|jgi:uncharacterized phage-associated protein|nr:type II toxin-antitoxin system antitoxin SocA domain-containing protein [Bryobacteraceae bacterium]